MWTRASAVLARPESFGSRMTLPVFKSCLFIERVPSSVRDANMMEKSRELCTDKFSLRAHPTGMKRRWLLGCIDGNGILAHRCYQMR